MKIGILHDSGDFYVGEIVAFSLTCGKRPIDLSQVQEIDWSVRPPQGGYIELKDGSRLGTFHNPEDIRVYGSITLKSESLKDNVSFDISEIVSMAYPYTGDTDS